MMMADSITAIRMNIPTIENVRRISGEFLDTTGGYSRTGLYSIGIIDASGVIHECNCEPLWHSNCLTTDSPGYLDVRDQLDAEILKNNTPHKALVNWLSGKHGEVWMYPNQAFFRPKNSCYKIAYETHLFLDFEQSIQDYTEAKTGLGVYFILILAPLTLLVFIIFIFVRTFIFLTDVKRC